jgi:hypothetical protein
MKKYKINLAEKITLRLMLKLKCQKQSWMSLSTAKEWKIGYTLNHNNNI